MRKLAFVFLLLAATPVRAEWSLIDETDGVYVYIDPSTLRKRGNTVKLWLMFDWKKSQKAASGREIRSSVFQKEFDCAEEQDRTLASTHYSEGSGKGNVVGSANTPNAAFEPVVPQTLGMAVFNGACEVRQP